MRNCSKGKLRVLSLVGLLSNLEKSSNNSFFSKDTISIAVSLRTINYPRKRRNIRLPIAARFSLIKCEGTSHLLSISFSLSNEQKTLKTGESLSDPSFQMF